MTILFFTAEKFAKLQRAKEVLTDPTSRQDYDKWRHSGMCMSYNDWCARRQVMQTVALINFTVCVFIIVFIQWFTQFFNIITSCKFYVAVNALGDGSQTRENAGNCQ